MTYLTFEDFAPGSVSTYGGITVTKDEVVAFAREFDPQAFHLDEAAAKDTFVGTLIASGWHTCALQMRMIADAFLLESACMGAPGIDEVKWLRPVRPGETLRVRQTVLETKDSRSRPEMGLVRFRFETLNGASEPVLEQTNWIMFGRRGGDLSPPAGSNSAERNGGDAPPKEPRPEAPPASAPSRPAAPARPARGEKILPSPYFEDLVIGDVAELGSHAFSAEDIMAYARRFDPQAFHVDPEAAKRSHFGGLCASGWHTAAAWMKLTVARRRQIVEAALARGERPAELGPSPGFTNLRWRKPVYAGDVISYRSALAGKRASTSRPGWGLVFNRNTGIDQHGHEVFSFDGCVFWQRRPGQPTLP